MTAPGPKKDPKEAATLSAAEIAKQSGVPTRLVIEYTEKYKDRMPHRVEGDRVRYFPRAVAAVQRLRREERAKKQATVEFTEADAYRSALGEIVAIRTGISELAKRAQEVERLLRAERPALAAVIYTLPEGYRLRQPLTVLIQGEGKGFVASLPEVPLDAAGRTRDEAAHGLRTLIVTTFERLEKKERLTDEERGQLDALLTLVETP